MKKKLFFIIFFLLIASITYLLEAQEITSPKPKDNFLQKLLNPKKKITPDSSQSNNPTWQVPAWLKRINYGIYLETEQKPRIYLETVQPLYQSEDKIHTLFTHDRISIQDERGTYSVGLGYRRLLFEEKLLAGINTFLTIKTCISITAQVWG